jgi:hypothetical protein
MTAALAPELIAGTQQIAHLWVGWSGTKNRLPVDAGGLHDGMRTTFRCKPIGERYQFLGGCLERLNPGHHFAVPQVTNAGHHRLLVNIETSAKRMQKFHRSSSAPLAWSPDRRNLESVLRGGKPPVATIRGAQGVPGPIVTRADAHQTHTISMATTRKHSTPTRLHVSSIAGRKHRWGLLRIVPSGTSDPSRRSSLQ